MDEITTSEIYRAIKTSAIKKSPGCDGLPREFFLRTFDVIHRELNLVLNEALRANFPSDFVASVIVLAKKKGGNNSAHSYRPISLTNFDYKVLCRILKQRMEVVIRTHRVLGNIQKCANPEHNIFEATLAIKDRFAKLIKTKQRGKLISFDLDHAFDRVNRNFVFGNMRALGFNRRLIDLLTRFADSSAARLLINGHLTHSAKIHCTRKSTQLPLICVILTTFIRPAGTNLWD